MGKKRTRNAAKSEARGSPPNPVADALFELAQRNHRAALGRDSRVGLEEAREQYERVLAMAPEHPGAQQLLGVVLHHLGRSEAAVSALRRAVARSPGDADAHNNLGNVLLELERPAEAADAYRAALAVRPDHGDALSNLGLALRRTGRLDAALDVYQRAVELRPEHALAHLGLAQALRRAGEHELALVHYRRSVVLGQGTGRKELVLTLARAGRPEEAIAEAQAWLQSSPEDPVALHTAASVGAREVPVRASDAYVEQTFDRFAPDFDARLRELEYRAPAQVAGVLGPGRGDLDVLDAGCGTGLCGPHLRPHARRLVGVDLSGAMLARAQALGCYDALVRAELTGFLAGRAAAYDLIVSADTLVYFGDLGPVLAAAARALRPGGRLVFTLESTGEVGWQLKPEGRYGHAEAYVRSTLDAVGLVPRSLEPVATRMEGGQAVDGWLVLAEPGQTA